MPRPHYPAQGGRRPASAGTSFRPAAGSPSGSAGQAAGAGQNVQALEAEVNRLKRELAGARKHGGGRSHLWLALAIFAGGLLFAVLAILNRGQ